MDKTASQRLGERIKKLREERKLTLGGLEALTEGFGERINKSYLFRVERGITTPSIPRLRIIAKVFKVRLTALVEVLDSSYEEQDVKVAQTPNLSGLAFDEVRRRGIQIEREGDFRRAAVHYRAALDMALAEAPNSERSTRIAKARIDLAVALKNLGNLELAREEAEEALELRGISEELLNHARLKLAHIYRRLKRSALAGCMIDQLMSREDKLSPELLIETYAAQGSLLLTEKPNEAAAWYRKALPIARTAKSRKPEVDIQYDIALAEMGAGHYSRALKVLHRTRDLASKLELHFLVARCQAEIGKAHYLMGAYEEARASIREAIGLARTREYYELLFQNQYYLRKISLSEGDAAAARVAEAGLKFFATRIEEEFEELREFRSELRSRSEEGAK
jgi:transcriptional regulator with XRE-family HTH domain